MTNPAGDSKPQPRSPRGKFIRSVDSIDRDRDAERMITEGLSYQDTADRLGYPDKSACWRAVQAFRREAAKLDGNSELLRQQQLAEMTELKRRLWDQLNNPYPAISRTGKIVTDDDGEPVPDATAIAAAQTLLVRVSERIARIRGTDAPRRSVTLTGRPGPDEILAFMDHVNPEDMQAALVLIHRKVKEAEQEAAEAGDPPRAIAGTVEP